MYQNLCNAAKAVLRVKFIAINLYIKKQESSEMNNLPLSLKERKKNKLNPELLERRKSQNI